MLRSRPFVVAFGLLIAACFTPACLAPATASAQASLINGLGGTADYGPDCLGMNDDGSSASIDLLPFFPSGLRFFDRTHTTVFINTNGNISFSNPVPTFTAQAFPVADQPMIAPYWADVDIRGFDRMRGFMRDCFGPRDGDTTLGAACHEPTQNGVWWHFEAGRMIVTWDRVSYFKCHDDNSRRMSFQLVITEVEGACGATGDFDVEFRYNQCDWTTGDASGGTGGFGGTQAQAGFDAGNSADFVEIAGSRTDTIHTILCTDSNVGETGIWRFQIRSGEVICPGAGDACDTGMQGVCSTGRTQCIAAGIQCRPEIGSSDETCDALDNDCDGVVDEGDTLCESFEVCREGSCTGDCFEGGCATGFTCTSEGLCVDDACLTVSCGAGERCEAGACVSPCAGVVCPGEFECVVGLCVDLCAGATCDDCSVCDAGACTPRCQTAGCASGEACRFDGVCVDAGCEAVSCDTGTHCEGGACVDSCTGAVCPGDDVCAAGVCGPPPPPVDGGVTPADAGPGADSGPVVPGVDGGGPPMDAGGPPGGESDGCGCRVPGPSAPRGPLGLALGVLGIFLTRRRPRA